MQIRYGDLRDKDAHFALLAPKMVILAIPKVFQWSFESRDPFGSFMGLIMEGVQFVDEQMNGGE